MSEYDTKIHSSNNAQDWARFFIKNKNETNFMIDEELMIGWFSNAMMAMSDHIHNNQIQTLQKENEILKEALIDIATHDTLDGEKYHNFNAAYNGVVEFAQLTIDYIEGNKK